MMIYGSFRPIVRLGLAVTVAVAIALLTATAGTAFSHSAPYEQEASPTSTNCYQAGYDGQTFDPRDVLQPGSSYSTTWRVVNNGNCAWTPEYVWTFVGGERMSAPDNVPIGEEVQPGEIIEVTLHLSAPQSEGVYTGYWALQDPNGTLFGVSPDANSAFFVSIFVSTDPDAVHPGGIPRFYLEIDPNRTQEPPTETPTPTERPATATLTSTVTQTESSTPTPTAVISQPEQPLIPFDDQYRNVRYREAGPFVPEFTTSIPSPLDVSLDPAVIGTNILLASLLMIPFAYANELLSRMLEEFKKKRADRKRSSQWLRTLQERFDRSLIINAKGRIGLRGKLKVLILILLYGLVFSLLDNTWNPFSAEGALLFISMAITFGVIGMADDFIQWRRIRKWDLPARLKFNPSNLLLAIVSTFISRSLFLMPGLMFGTPEVLKANEEAISQKKQEQLLRISMITFIIIGLAAWIPTIITGQILQGSLVGPGANMVILSGVEALLLIIFAVTIENFFIQLLGFPGSFGRMLKRSNRPLWFVTLIAATFMFIHTLINPRGDLVEAIQKGNVIVFIGVVVSFIVGVFIVQAILWIRKRRS